MIGKKGKERRDKIINEALSLIRQGGIQALTMRKVAILAGITEASAYRYFPDKASLLTGIIEKFKAELIGPITLILESESAPEIKLQEVVSFHLQFVNASEGLPLVFMAEIASGNEKALVPHIRGVIESYQGILEELLKGIIGNSNKPTAKEFATMLFGMATAVAIQRRLGIHNQAHEEMSSSVLPFIISCLVKIDNNTEAT